MNRYCHQSVVLIGLIVVFFASQVQAVAPPDVEALREHLRSVMSKMRAGKQATHEENEFIRTADPERAFEALRAFEEDDSPEVRSYVYWIEGSLLFRGHPPFELRRRIIERFVRAMCVEPDAIADSLYDMELWKMTADDFTNQAKNWIRTHLQKQEPRTYVMLLSGLADLQDQIPRLKELRAEEADYAVAVADTSDALTYLNIVRGWQARLALARLGSQEDIAHCIEKIEAAPDAYIQVRQLLPYYGYIRQPEVIPILQRYLERDDVIDEGYTPAGRYAQKILEEIVEGFPAKTDLATARAWMRAQMEFTITR